MRKPQSHAGLWLKFSLLCLCFSHSAAFGQSTDASLSQSRALIWPDNYDFTQIQPLVNAAVGAFENTDWERAEELALEALQVAKASHGLASPQQMPGLDILLRSLIAQGRWRATDRYLEYFEWLNEEVVLTDLNAYLEGAESLSNLYLTVAADEDIHNSARYLVNAKNLNWRAVTAIEYRFGRESKLLEPWLYKIVLTHFYQSILTRRRGMTSYEYKTDADEIVPGWSLSLNESLRSSHSVGEELLQRLGNMADNPQARGVNLVYLGDWELLFDNPGAAYDYYRQAFSAMEQAGVGRADINDFFARSAIIPRTEYNTNLHRPDTPLRFIAWSFTFPGAARPVMAAPLNQSYGELAEIEVRFSLIPGLENQDAEIARPTLTHLTIESMELISPAAIQQQEWSQAQREIQNLHFRPRLQDLVAVPQTVNIFYRFPRQASVSMVSR